MRSILKLVPMLLLSACTSNLRELESISPKADGFSGSLAVEYLAYSQSEAEQGHFSSAEHFASKGIKASRGEEVEPDNVNDKIANSKTLSAYRKELVDIFTRDVKNISPEQSARAQLLFDCWNNQENDKLSSGAVREEASCADEFALVYDELRDVADKIMYGENNQQVIRFFEGSSELDSEEKNTIRDIATHIKKHKDSALVLSTPLDNKLAQKRLANVRSTLIKVGVVKNKIIIEKSRGDEASEVVLSNDMLQNKDKVDVIITSPQHVAVVSNE